MDVAFVKGVNMLTRSVRYSGVIKLVGKIAVSSRDAIKGEEERRKGTKTE